MLAAGMLREHTQMRLMRRLSSRLGIYLLIGWGMLLCGDASAQDVTLALVPGDPNASSWNLVLDCPNTAVSAFTTGFVLPQSLAPSDIVDFGPGCGPINPVTKLGDCVGAALPPTVDPLQSFILGPGFLGPPGTRLDTLYVHLQAPPGGTLCATGSLGNPVANFIIPLPGPVHTRQGTDLLPAPFLPGFISDMGIGVSSHRILFFRGAVPPVIFGVGVRRANGSLDPNVPFDPNGPQARWEITLFSPTVEYNTFTVGLILPPEAMSSNAVFGGCDAPGPGLFGQRLCSPDLRLGPNVDPATSQTLGPATSLAGIARTDTLYITARGKRQTALLLPGLNRPGKKVRLGEVEFNGFAFATDFPLLTFEGLGSPGIPPSQDTSGAVPSLPPMGGGPNGETEQEDNEEGDQDADTMGDDVDNCIFEANDPNWSDHGGVGFPVSFDGIGDVCQCGDLGRNGVVLLDDANDLRNALAEVFLLDANSGVLCNVYGTTDPNTVNTIPLDCDMVDAVVITRAVQGQGPSISPVCDPAATPP